MCVCVWWLNSIPWHWSSIFICRKLLAMKYTKFLSTTRAAWNNFKQEMVQPFLNHIFNLVEINVQSTFCCHRQWPTFHSITSLREHRKWDTAKNVARIGTKSTAKHKWFSITVSNLLTHLSTNHTHIICYHELCIFSNSISNIEHFELTTSNVTVIVTKHFGLTNGQCC